ncbi:hypothetical protein F7725_024223, partial [Dissostichus mawsoni]
MEANCALCGDVNESLFVYQHQMETQSAETAACIVPHSCLTSATIEKLITAVIPGKDPVPNTSIQMDRDTLQDGISTRDGREQEGDLCHKSGPGLMSEWPRRKVREEVWSGDASLQQTSVLGPGDGCGTKPEGNANKIKGAVADCYKERPESGGSSLSSMSHLQSSRGTRSTSVLPQNSTHPQLDIKPLCSQAARCPPEKTIFEGLFGCAEIDESGGLQGFTTECSQPEPRPALLVLAETGLFTLTADSGHLVMFHQRPLVQLKEVQIGLAGHSLRLMGSSEESILGVYTHSQNLTKYLYSAILGVICPWDRRVSQHPLLHGDLMMLSLDWQASVPEMLLDTGLKVCCQFQKSLADLVFFLHCNMEEGA